KTASPVTYVRRRPNLIPTAAAVMIPAAKVSAYALTAQFSVPIEPPTERWMAGSAVTTTSASSATMKNDTEVSARISPGDPARRPGPAPRAGPGPASVSAAAAAAESSMPSLRRATAQIDRTPRLISRQRLGPGGLPRLAADQPVDRQALLLLELAAHRL